LVDLLEAAIITLKILYAIT